MSRGPLPAWFRKEQLVSPPLKPRWALTRSGRAHPNRMRRAWPDARFETVLSENSIAVSQHDLRPRQNACMMPDFLRLRLILATFAGWVTRDQAQVIAALVHQSKRGRNVAANA